VLARTLEYVREVDSTNNLLKNSQKKALPSEFWILAGSEFAGKGRQDEVFIRPTAEGSI
jgi:biotin-(acetyl-CoA carboxylase) ligase